MDPGRARSASASTVEHPDQYPDAGAPVGGGVDRAITPDDDDDEAPIPLPWHFKLLVGAIALYLGWRAFQGVEWLVQQL